MLMDKVKNFLKTNPEGDNKKKIENLAVFVVILIVTLIAINVIWNGKKEENPDSSKDPNKKLATVAENSLDINTVATNTQDTLSMQLEEILEKIEGVGKAKVLITYSQTNSTIPMYNEDTSQKDTEEKDTSRRY